MPASALEDVMRQSLQTTARRVASFRVPTKSAFIFATSAERAPATFAAALNMLIISSVRSWRSSLWIMPRICDRKASSFSEAVGETKGPGGGEGGGAGVRITGGGRDGGGGGGGGASGSARRAIGGSPGGVGDVSVTVVRFDPLWVTAKIRTTNRRPPTVAMIGRGFEAPGPGAARRGGAMIGMDPVALLRGWPPPAGILPEEVRRPCSPSPGRNGRHSAQKGLFSIIRARPFSKSSSRRLWPQPSQ